ncbi:MAG TPA: GntR family transcriptional regulator [Bacillota bacterium]
MIFLNLIEHVYKVLRKEILEGKLAPGTRLTEMQLAERFNMSRTPVREALARLRNEGLVSLAPGVGLIVREVSLRDMEELMGIRGVLEAYALEQAFDHLTEADLLQMELFVNQSQYYLRENNIKAIFENNTKFHDYILKKSMNKRLQTILSNLMDSILSFRIVTLHYPGNPQKSIERHGRIIQAIKNKDKDLAKRLIIEDVNAGKEILDELYSDSPEKSV